MATAQEARSSNSDQGNASSENKSKQMTRGSNRNQLNRSGEESQGADNQPQTQQPVQPASQETGKKSSAPRVRLDMDLDVELQLKAKIQGDLELAILSRTVFAASDPDARLYRTMKRNHSGEPIMSVYRSSRLPVSCRPCREKKRRCDRNQPCSNCTQRHLTCVYENGSRAANSLESDTLQQRNFSEAQVDPNGSAPAFVTLGQMSINKGVLERLNRLEKAVFPDGVDPLQTTSSDSRSSCRKLFNSHTETTPDATSFSINTRVENLASKLPPLGQANLLFDHFIATIQPTFGVLHVPSTRDLVQDAYSKMNSGHVRPQTAELLMLLSIFAGAALAWTDELLQKLEATKENATTAFDSYFHSALSIVDDIRTPVSPSVTAVSAISALAHVAINSDVVSPIKALSLRSRCYLMCREMMIHRLDSPGALKEREATGANTIDLEVQRRVWWNMVASDWLTSFSGSSQEGVYTFIPRLMRVNKPGNVDDAILKASGPTYNAPLTMPTDMTFFLLRLKTAEISREIVDAIPPLVDEAPEEDYDIILDLDKKLQDFANSLPEFSYKILELRRMMDDATAKLNFRPEKYWVIFLHVTSAAVTLAVDLSHNPNAPDAEALQEKVKVAYETLNKSRKNAQSLIKGIEKNMEQVMGTLQKQLSSTVTSASPAEVSSAKWDSVPDSAFTDMNDTTMGIPDDGFGDEHSHQLWSDFLAAVPDLEEFQWTSLLQDVDFDPSNFG
ncbi:hypothetical protein FBEOM_13421 [Fusarium beomiforme]|uniref:Zn(2)-C6 fungal-type domain-containing protein n=1 Tax=Fusarium beomiforme TaxID=44412 RepID=A0A9P5DNM1_9HYPO|nr:hypothetical protein FBEOM_13421 [Fusarium beomiforme]